MSQPLRIAFIGGAINSAIGYTHYAASGMDGHWQLVAGCFSRNSETNKRTGERYGLPPEHICPDVETLLATEKENLDAVAVLTPIPSHYDIVMQCLKSGIPVICEKALTGTSTEASALAQAAAEHNGFLSVTYNYSGYPMVRELRRMITAGELGRVCFFRADMPQEGYMKVDENGRPFVPQDWRLQDGRIPTIHLDLGAHLHQLLGYLLNAEPLAVNCSQATYGAFSQVVDNVSCLARYAGEIEGQIWFSKAALGYRNGLRLQIYGDRAAAEWCQTNPEEIVLSHSNSRRETIDRGRVLAEAGQERYNRFKAGHPAGYLEAFANLYSDLADCLREYKASGTWNSTEVFDAAFAARGLQMLEAMTDSADSGNWVDVPPSTERPS